jgi:ribosomal protein S18 acetylase RimI-like enzyme
VQIHLAAADRQDPVAALDVVQNARCACGTTGGGSLIQRLHIRAAEPTDIDAIYTIALRTGASGQDATHLYTDGRLVGHIWAAPYVLLEPGSGFVVEDEDGVGGYIVGTIDTRAFDARLEAQWWPTLRPLYADPWPKPASQWSADETAGYLIHRPLRTPDSIVEPYPSHLHINLLPRLQGKGVGAVLITRWLDHMRSLGSRGAHFAVSPANARALAFYRAYGFVELPRANARPYEPVWFAMRLA